MLLIIIPEQQTQTGTALDKERSVYYIHPATFSVFPLREPVGISILSSLRRNSLLSRPEKQTPAWRSWILFLGFSAWVRHFYSEF
jgi:hypothetical protein